MGMYVYKSKVPAKWNCNESFRNTLEGDDDMLGNVKSSICLYVPSSMSSCQRLPPMFFFSLQLIIR